MVTLLTLAAGVYLGISLLMLGMGIGHEMGHRNPEWGFVFLAAVFWPLVVLRMLVQLAMDRFQNP